MIALGVRDLPRSVKFYRDGLRFVPSSASNESIAFFKTGGTVLALHPWDKLAGDAQVPDEGHGFRGVTLAHNVRERQEVGEVLALAAASGGKIIKPAQDVFWGGHSGYFPDPDGHLWEVCWNPHVPLADGTVLVPLVAVSFTLAMLSRRGKADELFWFRNGGYLGYPCSAFRSFLSPTTVGGNRNGYPARNT